MRTLLLPMSLLLLVTLLLLPGCLSAQTQRYTASAAGGGSLDLTVHKTGLMSGKKHLFVFPEYAAELDYDVANPAASRIVLRISAARIQCKDDWVNDKDLKKIEAEARDKLLEAGKHPELLFRSTRIQPQPAGRYLVEGTLAIRGVARPVTVTVNMQPGPAMLSFDGEATVDMTAWGLKPPSAGLGTVGTNKLMQFRFRFDARR
ncbi:MAG: YceI family protein [Bryobacterales bacterium]|jgi:polyisoprenoid-binding protein YceI|nr:YceI family protein [Bryobacterales bacterium]